MRSVWKPALIAGLVLGAIPAPATIQRLERRWALVVAIDAYRDDGLPQRNDAVASARRLSELLMQRYGYEPERVIRLMNAEATTAGLFTTISELRKRIGREDSLLVYVSLHSVRTQTRAALVPFDGRAGEAWTWVSLEAVVEALSGLASGAVLAVFDSCVADDPAGLSRREALALRTLPSGSIEILSGCPMNPLRGPTGVGAVLADELDRAADEGRGLAASDLIGPFGRSLGTPDSVGYSRPSFVIRPAFAFVPSETDPLRAVRTGDAATKKRAIADLGEQLRSQPTGEAAAETVRALLAVASNAGEDAEVRSTAVAALSAGQGPLLASELSRILVDAKAPEPLRLQIVDTLEQLKDPESIRALDRAAARGSLGVRVASLRALARLGARSSMPVFAGVLKGPAPAEVQAAALEAIQLLGPGTQDPTVVQSVLAVVERSRTDAALRRTAVTTLGGLADPSSERALLSLLKGDPDAGVRAAAASALGRLSSHADPNLAVMALEQALTEPSGFVREAAAVALGRLKALRAESALIRTLKDPEASVRSAAAEALGKLAAEGARPDLVPSLADVSPDVRRAAAVALNGRCDDATQVALLDASVGDQDRGVREAANHSLAGCRARGPDQAKPSVGLPDWTRSADPRTRAEALRRLAATGSDKAAGELVAALGDPDDLVRQTAVQLLGASATFLPDLQRTLASDSSVSVARAGAVSAAGQIATREALALVLGSTEDRDRRVRVAAIRALGNFADPQAAQLAQRLSGDKDPEVGLAAADAMSAQSRLLFTQSQYDEGLSLARGAYEARQRLPSQPADVATDLNNMAAFHIRLGQLAAAQELLERALGMRLKLLGEAHPDVAVSLSNLAAVFQGLNQPERAEPLFLQALRIRQTALGPSHPEVVQSLENLVSFYDGLGKKEEADRYRARALEARRLGEKKAAF